MKINAITSMIDTVNPIVGAEVGAWRGRLSNQLLNNLPNLTLHIVDLWRPWKAKGEAYHLSVDITQHISEIEFEQIYQQVKILTAPFSDRVVINRDDSVAAAATYDSDYFDFVFIDAEHSETALTLDIAAWYPKVKPGGWLCGHDYQHEDFPGVAKAVDAFAENINAVVKKVGYSCWFIKRPSC